MLETSLTLDTAWDKLFKGFAREGYRMMLAGVPRLTAEFSSNMAYVAIAALPEYINGVKILNNIEDGDLLNIMLASGSGLPTRLYPHDPLSGRFIDTSAMNKRTGSGESTMKSGAINKLLTVHNKTTKKAKNLVETLADNMISISDKAMMRPLWAGKFFKAFKDITGTDLDLSKMKSNDAKSAALSDAYLIKYKDALYAARREADKEVIMAGNVDNPFMNSLRSHIPANAGAVTRAFKVFNNFMNKFVIGEFLTIRKGTQAAVGNGEISRGKGVRLVGAAAARMTIYIVVGKVVTDFVRGLFSAGDDDDDDKSIAQTFGQALATTATTVLLGRTYGNVVRTVTNIAVEKANEKYMTGLRNGEYDPYEDAIQFTFVPPEKSGDKLEAYDILTAGAGPYSPLLKTFNFAVRKFSEEEKKEAAAIERSYRENWQRLPLEIAGHIGYVPFYKDIRAIVNKSIYAELDKELKAQENKQEEFKPMGLEKTDLKRYYPDIYERYYGKGSAEEAKRKIENAKNLLEQKIKDERYKYTPKKKARGESDGFGSKGFGESDGFGSKGFGE
jgi:hypothetical protein